MQFNEIIQKQVTILYYYIIYKDILRSEKK